MLFQLDMTKLRRINFIFGIMHIMTDEDMTDEFYMSNHFLQARPELNFAHNQCAVAKVLTVDRVKKVAVKKIKKAPRPAAKRSAKCVITVRLF